MLKVDFYELLEVSPSASAVEIKRAYRAMALKYHPDTGSEKDDQAMKHLNYIYSILSDPAKRESYDYSTRYQRETSQKNDSHRKPDGNSESGNNTYESTAEDYGSAVFVNSMKCTDSTGLYSDIKPGDYVYYPVEATEKILVFKYQSKDYYRSKVKKIYSMKHNTFRKEPLFVVASDGIEQIIFFEDFKKYWISSDGFVRLEKRNAIRAFVIVLIALMLIAYKLLSMG